LIMMHGAILRTRAFPSVLKAYALAAMPALVMLVGAIALLEINYRLSTEPESGTRMKLFWVGIDTATPWPWAVAGLFAVGGFYAFRKTWPYVAAAWQKASEEAALNRNTGDGK
jgi:hypothetical protein